MRQFVTIAIVAAAFGTGSASTQKPPVRSAVSTSSPSTDAMALAKSLGGDPANWLRRQSKDQIAKNLTEQLLSTVLANRGTGCDRANPDCVKAADRIARDAAQILFSEREAISNKLLAIVFDSHMSVAQLKAARSFIETPAGRGFASSLVAFGDPENLSPALNQELMAVLATPSKVSEGALAERFYNETASLPRGPQIAIPTPPPAGYRHD